ncbi:tRNA1(Val) (adenine(37)-N6)-methyltransferase [Clostridium bowmanii]|uniref:tRNA1(Val) (adenine(37)-N6)-methyltransferase n=1 Tax=Clostridium bowmanii TaxID=132925 RepID=UPI001C0DDDEB|nr:tRNA1(Val) (adenine(37)-N6)-methyltransferase [Clostridium bowmanii]MBU3189123.1 tRNA1(Val) (adenine(37)-N6)-methyltransferase [Clostridium bowmanii]MCA1073777.1 tRNA1(Val) (adenine(37)-N6)-methyltransferase [Clostridium bowmanii]
MEFLRDDETLDDLNLKDIQVIQKKDAFRFGIDAVLLANFAKVRRNAKVVDLCTGTGIIPFILAGKTYASDIMGLEIQEELVDMANRCAQYNNLEQKIKFICGDLKNTELVKSIPKVDVVTVNPPYKLQNSGLINLNGKNAIARHEICCTLEDVIIAIRIILKDSGRVYMVHRPDRLVDILCTMRKHKIEPKRIRMVHPSVNKAPNIVLIEGQRDGGTFLKWDTPLYVHTSDGGYTQEIKDMYNSDNI